jgi:hypothetical protein
MSSLSGRETKASVMCCRRYAEALDLRVPAPDLAVLRPGRRFGTPTLLPSDTPVNAEIRDRGMIGRALRSESAAWHSAPGDCRVIRLSVPGDIVRACTIAPWLAQGLRSRDHIGEPERAEKN